MGKRSEYLKSDFAQKLLHDLQRRKQMLGFASPTATAQGSTNAAAAAAVAPRDACRKPRTFRGARAGGNNKLHVESGGSIVKPGKNRGLTAKNSKETGFEGLSQDIVPVGTQQSTGNAIDISMALALALSNSGKLQNIDVLGKTKVHNEFTISFTDRNLSSTRLQVNQISSGVQKINSILGTYSGRQNIGNISFEIGRELLKEVVDLEKSISMLIMVQEASDHMAGSQSNRVLLLKGESSSSKGNQKKLMGTSRFLTDSDTETEQSTLDSYNKKSKIPQSRSTKSSSNVLVQFIRAEHSVITLQNNQLEARDYPGCSKVRIPNVVAKLMGLEELPPAKAEVVINKERKVKKPTMDLPTSMDSTARKIADQSVPLKRNAYGIRQYENPKGTDARILDTTKIEKKNQLLEYKPHSQVKVGRQADDDSTSHNKNRQPNKVMLLQSNTESRAQINHQGRMCYSQKGRTSNEENGIENKPTKHQMKNPCATQHIEKVKDATKGKQLLGPKSDVKSQKEEKTANDMSNQSALHWNKAAITSKTSAGESNYTDPMKKQSKINTKEKQGTRKKSSSDCKPCRTAGAKAEARENKQQKMSPAVEPVMNKSVDTLVMQDEESISGTVNRNENSQPIEDTDFADVRHLKQQASLINEVENKQKESGNKDEEALLQVMNLNQNVQAVNVPSTMHTDDGNKTQGPHMVDTAIQAGQAQQICIGKEQELDLDISKENQTDGIRNDKQPSNSSDIQNQKLEEVGAHDSLTKNQHLLMELLVSDRLFCSTAQALFSIDILPSAIQANGKAFQSKDDKLRLHCGLELMQRKAKREELTVSMKMLDVPTKIRSFGSLIKELYEDLESLIIHEQLQAGDYDTADYIQNMLEKDIQNGNPDTNCMWDLDWSFTTPGSVEKDGVVKDLEKQLLNGLITEIAKDLTGE